MKRTITLILTITCLLVSVSGLAQQASISLSRNRASLSSILLDIKKQTGLEFVYNAEIFARLKKVSIHISNATLEEVLYLVLKDHGLAYQKFEGNTISIYRGKIQPPPKRLKQKLSITGKVLTTTGDAIASASIMALASSKHTTSAEDGTFKLDSIFTGDSLVVSCVSYERLVWIVGNERSITINLETAVRELSEVVVSTGFQKQKQESATGSFSVVNQELLNYKVTTNILDRLDGVTSGLLFNKNIQPGNGTNQSTMSIRGRSTIFANPEPLVILDNFPYTGDVNNINPNDIESVTVLKDAAAASIWGAYAANGVIVITSKMGRYNQPIKLSFNANVTVSDKPDLYYLPTLNSSDYIDAERFLFQNGHYTERETNPLHPALSAAVEIMIQERDGLISPAKAKTLLDELGKLDVREDMEKHFYRHSINQQYAINASGGGPQNQYYFSAGYDRNLPSQVGNQYDRLTLNANNTYAWFNRKLQLTTGIIFSTSNTRNANNIFSLNFPYLNLVDDNGQPATVYLNLRQSYLDTVGSGRLLDWNYRPWEELRLSNNKGIHSDYRVNAGLKYNIFKGFTANLLYQYNKGYGEQRNHYNQSSFFTRDLINKYTQINNGVLSTPIPYGDILDKINYSSQAHNLRLQTEYQRNWNKNHTLNVFAGAEVRSFKREETIDRLYGYNPQRQVSLPVDYKTTFTIYNNPSQELAIPFVDRARQIIDRFVSYFINGAYTYKQRYTISASARKDESNIFGVKTNQKGVPLWSTGISWDISKEAFYTQAHWLPYLRLRVTHGYNGNVDRKVSAFTTAKLEGQNTYGAPSGEIINPPNPALRWEKVGMTNIGLDFASLNNTVNGSVEYYYRKAKDLIGSSPLDPTTGVAIFRGNTANMKGSGIDLTINTQNIDSKKFKWSTTFLISHTKDEVTEYKVRLNSIGNYVNSDFLNPLKGRPVFAMYSFYWDGLDSATGDPRGILDGSKSYDYSGLFSSQKFDNLYYNGPVNPTFFGSVRNTINYKHVQLSFNFTWKAGYYFRRSSIDYDELFNFNSKGHADYSKRWKKTGDELYTSIPSLRYPVDNLRNLFYRYSSVLVERGDHIRLQDIRLSYQLTPETHQWLPFQSFQLYVYANNIGILWKANRQGVDPDYVTGTPLPFSIAAGLKIDFK